MGTSYDFPSEFDIVFEIHLFFSGPLRSSWHWVWLSISSFVLFYAIIFGKAGLDSLGKLFQQQVIALNLLTKLPSKDWHAHHQAHALCCEYGITDDVSHARLNLYHDSTLTILLERVVSLTSCIMVRSYSVSSNILFTLALSPNRPPLDPARLLWGSTSLWANESCIPNTQIRSAWHLPLLYSLHKLTVSNVGPAPHYNLFFIFLHVIYAD